MKRLVFFASGSGTNFQAVIDAIKAGKIEAEIAGLIVDKPGRAVAKRAERNGICIEIISPEKSGFGNKLLQILARWRPHLIVLAGYMFKIPHEVIEAYPKQIINIHPSLLPKFGGKGFYGKKVHKAVLKAGDTQTGCSVHIVTDEYDKGPVISQKTVAVYDFDTPQSLAKRVLEQEHTLLPEAIQTYISNL